MAKRGPDLTGTEPYYAQWGGWEVKPLKKARANMEKVFKSDFSPAGLALDWLADGVAVESKKNCAVVTLAPEAAAAGKQWGVLWYKTPVFTPFMVEVEFTLDSAGPHDANFFWGQNVLSKENMGKEQECYMACYFGWGGKSCGFERSSDWRASGVTGTLDPKPGKKQTGTWILYGKKQWMYLEEKLLIFAENSEKPPAKGHFALGVYMSKVTYHSVKVFKLYPAKK